MDQEAANQETKVTVVFMRHKRVRKPLDSIEYSRRSTDVSLSLLKAIREHILQLLESVPEAWNRAVVVRTPHGEMERIPVGFVIQMQGDHVLHHLKRIQAILQERGGP